MVNGFMVLVESIRTNCRSLLIIMAKLIGKLKVVVGMQVSALRDSGRGVFTLESEGQGGKPQRVAVNIFRTGAGVWRLADFKLEHEMESLGLGGFISLPFQPTGAEVTAVWAAISDSFGSDGEIEAL